MKKTVLITGASRGIGREIASLFSKNDYNVAINYHQSEALAQDFVQQLIASGCDAISVHADVSSFDQTSAMVHQVIDRFGAIDVLICNAGIAQVKMLTDICDEDWNRMFEVNTKGIFNCCKAVSPQMISGHQGKIITISSVWGVVGASCETHYSASKAAVIGFTKALAKELGPSGITVNCIAPGVIATDMNAALSEADLLELKNQTPLGRIGLPSDVAHLALFLASEGANFITGQVINVGGGFGE